MGLFRFKGMRIQARLRKAFNMIIVIASIGSVVGILSLIISRRTLVTLVVS